jgi:hypothetical protein
MYQPSYYEQVRDHVERIAECTTSDAQGIIEAWERTSPESIDGHEEMGTNAEQVAQTILEPKHRVLVNRKERGRMTTGQARELANQLGMIPYAPWSSACADGMDRTSWDKIKPGQDIWLFVPTASSNHTFVSFT